MINVETLASLSSGDSATSFKDLDVKRYSTKEDALKAARKDREEEREYHLENGDFTESEMVEKDDESYLSLIFSQYGEEEDTDRRPSS